MGLIKRITGLFERNSRLSELEWQNSKFEKVIDNAISKFKVGKLKSGLNELLSASNNYQHPLNRILLAYNLGAVHWDQIGFNTPLSLDHQHHFLS